MHLGLFVAVTGIIRLAIIVNVDFAINTYVPIPFRLEF